MSKVNLVDSRVKMDLEDIVKYQLLTHCYINRIDLPESALKCLTLLALIGTTEITEFCVMATHSRIFNSTQTVRNCLVKLEKNNLIVKNGTNKKTIHLNPDLKIQTQGNILLNYKIVYVSSKESQEVY
jgi:hypothetical protein